MDVVEDHGAADVERIVRFQVDPGRRQLELDVFFPIVQIVVVVVGGKLRAAGGAEELVDRSERALHRRPVRGVGVIRRLEVHQARV